MTFRDWCKKQIKHHDNLAARYRLEEIRAYHDGASNALHQALTAYERDQNQQHRERKTA